MPVSLLEPLQRIAVSGEIEEMRVQAVRAIGGCPDPQAIPVLTGLVGARRRFLLGLRLPRPLAVLLEALRGLAVAAAAGVPLTAEAREVLILASRSGDLSVREATALR